MKNNIKFDVLAKAQIEDNKQAVISRAKEVVTTKSMAKYTIAQQVTTIVDGNSMGFFIKGGIKVKDLDGLRALHEALGIAIEKELKIIE